MIQVLIYMTANPGQAAELKLALLKLSRSRCQEIGCRKCNLLQDVTNQERFILMEEWSLQERLESKLSSGYLQDFFREGEVFLAEAPSLQWFQVVDP